MTNSRRLKKRNFSRFYLLFYVTDGKNIFLLCVKRYFISIRYKKKTMLTEDVLLHLNDLFLIRTCNLIKYIIYHGLCTFILI